jgi:hypothetical protein
LAAGKHKKNCSFYKLNNPFSSVANSFAGKDKLILIDLMNV